MQSALILAEKIGPAGARVSRAGGAILIAPSRRIVSPFR